MQNGPRFLTDADINTIQLYTAMSPGAGPGAWTPGFNTDPRELGYDGVTANGRRYRWMLIGGTSTVTPGTLMTAPAQPANSTGLAIPTAQPANTATGSGPTGTSALASGSLSFNVTNGVTAVTADEFAGGFVDVLQTSGTNPGPTTYQLKGNTAAANGGAITLYLAEPLQQGAGALVAATDTVNLRYNTYFNVVASATLAQPVGIVTVQVPNTASAQYYAWVQTGGQVEGVATDNITAFDAVTQSTADAGWVQAIADDVHLHIGQALSTGTDTNPISLCLNLP